MLMKVMNMRVVVISLMVLVTALEMGVRKIGIQVALCGKGKMSCADLVQQTQSEHGLHQHDKRIMNENSLRVYLSLLVLFECRELSLH